MISVSHTIIIIAVSAVITLLLRAFPFIVFSGKKEMPAMVKKVADSLPPAIMGVLVVYCLKDFIVTVGAETIAAFISVILIVAVHLLKKNTLFSIALGTAVYMILIRIM